MTALPEEAICLTGRRVRPDSLLILSESVRLKLSGVGRERAAAAARSLVEQGAGALMSFGTTAGLVTELCTGGLVVPKNVITIDGAQFFVDLYWQHRLCTMLGHESRDSSIVEVIEPVCQVESKLMLASVTGAVAADMESAAIIRVARESGVASLVVRVVVDPLSMTLPSSAIAAVSPSGARSWLGLCQGLVRRPSELVTLCRLALAFAVAQRSLARVALSAGPEFCAFESNSMRSRRDL